ncbi:MAG: FtsB family cell division protein [Saccharofermentanales bacterium]
MGSTKKVQKNGRLKKRPIRRIIQPILVGLGIILMLAIALSIYFSQEDKIAELKQRNIELSGQIEIVKVKKDELKELLDNWQTPEYIEKIAREEFGMVKPGEVIFRD